VDAFLQPPGDRQIERLDHIAPVGFCVGFATQQQIVDLLVNEVVVATQVTFVDVEAGGAAKEAFEAGNVRHGHGRFSCNGIDSGDSLPVQRARN
jgi:hypothetical protein